MPFQFLKYNSAAQVMGLRKARKVISQFVEVAHQLNKYSLLGKDLPESGFFMLEGKLE